MSFKPDTSIGLIGRGAIGGAIAAAIESGSLPGLVLTAVLTRTPPLEGASEIWCGNLKGFLARTPDLVIEAAGPEAFATLVPSVLANGCDVIAVSVAALADDVVEAAVNAAIAKSGARLHVASGAIGALDSLAAARELGLDSVELVQRKPHAAFPGVDLQPGMTQIVSTGTARDAAIAFPRNSNIAAAVALAGVGFDQTRVTVVADHEATTNQAELKVSGRFGRFDLTIQNRPSEANARTAAITAQSVISALRRSRAAIAVPA
ncbi:aspartate dehydrogenase [Martelella endophytica]|uniref:L-aspartate dehydrogenase n=1 Tax=Martelella endophytica TaxID=1486262 RepID=A0A0D5LLM3_MAREN|nr:aspartate dehydrogenase [Martelella endophytica]AJY45051.1 hypothetical protein TM49_04070 [Martelella endophytica]